jgi:catechol 2,3-dioxygenase-like lactoylglutathione lyase family enzyme
MPLALTGLTPLIAVYDMPKAIRFYCGILGFELVTSSPEIDAPEGRYFHWAWLRQGGAELMLNTAHDEGERPAHRDTVREGGHEDTCLYIGCADIDAVHAELTSRGLTLEPPVITHYGMKQLYLRDPDGFGLCFQTRTA